ncbi:MAG: GvpL/GvpF family gas vesicle protein [Candidatus Bathyarchaeia archaeon]
MTTEECNELLKKPEEKEERREEQGKYLYGIILCSEEKSFGHIGINGEEVHTIPYEEIAAVVSNSPMKDYEITEDNTRRHIEVLRQIMERHTVIPAEFGTTIKNDRILKHLLTKSHDLTRKCLKLVDNMVELGVKAILNSDTGFTDPEKRKECTSDILGTLNTMAKQSVTGNLFTNRLVLNASFLVNKEDIDAFSEKVARLQEKYPMVKLLYSGLWPPHNFVYIKIGAQGIEINRK